MKTFIKNLVVSAASRVRSTNSLLQWIESGFNLEAIPQSAIDELSELAAIAEDKEKIAVCDLLRLLVLKDNQCEYIIASHWQFIQVTIFDYLQGQNLQDAEAKTL